MNTRKTIVGARFDPFRTQSAIEPTSTRQAPSMWNPPPPYLDKAGPVFRYQ
jgi:hypothetical protein